MKSRRTVMSTALIALLVCPGVAADDRVAGSLTLAAASKSPFSIVVSDNASPSTRYAAEELQRFVEQISGAKLSIRSASGPVVGHEIVLGDNAHLRKLGLNIDFNRLGPEGYTIRTVGKHLVIAGGGLRGNLYGVYGLLEDHLGCRWFTPTLSRIPQMDPLVIESIDETKIPVLEYREPFVMDCFDGDWCARNRVNSSAAALEARHGGKVRFGNGMFVHTFNRLMPPETYFDAHPEYYSEVGGKRLRQRTQLCCAGEVLTYTPAEPVEVDSLVPGLEYARYEGTWDKLPDFSTLRPARRGSAETFAIRANPRKEYFALRFTGYIRVPRDGLYTFYSTSNDGSRLLVAAQVVVENDGLHTAKKVGGFIALKAGLHPIELQFFQEGGTAELAVSFEGPGISARPIPASALFRP